MKSSSPTMPNGTDAAIGHPCQRPLIATPSPNRTGSRKALPAGWSAALSCVRELAGPTLRCPIAWSRAGGASTVTPLNRDRTEAFRSGDVGACGLPDGRHAGFCALGVEADDLVEGWLDAVRGWAIERDRLIRVAVSTERRPLLGCRSVPLGPEALADVRHSCRAGTRVRSRQAAQGQAGRGCSNCRCRSA